MADIDKIAVNNTTYNIKDSTARDSISRLTVTDIKKVQFLVYNGSFNIIYTLSDDSLLRFSCNSTSAVFQSAASAGAAWNTIWTK